MPSQYKKILPAQQPISQFAYCCTHSIIDCYNNKNNSKIDPLQYFKIHLDILKNKPLFTNVEVNINYNKEY